MQIVSIEKTELKRKDGMTLDSNEHTNGNENIWMVKISCLWLAGFCQLGTSYPQMNLKKTKI